MSDHIPGLGTPMPASDITYQIDPRSAPRSRLNCQKYIHPEGDAKNTGAFTAIHVTAAVASSLPNALRRRDRRQSSSKGPRMNSG